MDFRILGPLEVREGEREVTLGRGKQRALLALLILHRDQAISTDRIADELWGERPPPTAAKIVQNHVLQLRRALEDGGSAGADLVTRGHGYMLRVGPGKLDLDTFEQLVEAGERALGSGQAAAAAETLREALTLWRGPPLADFAYEPFAQAAIERLEELRLAALERRIEADLALGRHADVVGELKELVSAHPLREGFRAQLMLALYRSGRQAEALEVYRDARRSLVEELGIDPSPALQELEQAILRQELPPAPERPPRGPGRPLPGARAGVDARGGRRRSRGRRRRLRPRPPHRRGRWHAARGGVGRGVDRFRGSRPCLIHTGGEDAEQRRGRGGRRLGPRRRRPDDLADRSAKRRHREDLQHRHDTEGHRRRAAGRSGSAIRHWTRATPEASRGSIRSPPS